MNKTLRLSIATAVLGFIASAASWTSVPATMPIHWDAAGQPNGYASRTVGLLLLPIVAASVAGLLHLGHEKLDASVSRALGGTAVLSSVFFIGLHGAVIAATLTPGHVLSMGAVTGLMGLIFAALGLMMRGLKPNGRIGIRLPWTIGDEVTWSLTHRCAAWTFAIGGLVALTAGLLCSGSSAFVLGLVAILAGATAPMIYSYAISRMRR